jgi:hypothetical protein
MPIAETISEMQRLLMDYSWKEAQPEARIRGIRWLVELGGEQHELSV